MKNKLTRKQNTQEIEHQMQEAELLEEQSKNKELMVASENAQVAGEPEKTALANQLFGRLQLAGAMTKMLTISTLLDLKKVKEEKLYLNFKGVPVISPMGETRIVSTWNDFCLALGLSRQHVDEQLLNIKAFGTEAYEAMTNAGIGIRAMRPARQLPEDAFNAVVCKIKSNAGDKDTIIELVEEIAVKHSKEKEKLNQEKEDLQKQLDETQANQEANDKFLEAKEQKINELEKVVNKCLTPDEEKQRHNQIEAELKSELESIVTSCNLEIMKLNAIMEKVFLYDKGTEELQSQPYNQYEYLLRQLVNVGVKNELKFDVKGIFGPLMVMFEGFAPEDSM